jgi:phosphatidylglycerol:prolipoprotein diacylglycerol transferase
VHPVLFHIGAFVIPSYGVVAAVGVLLALLLAMHNARKVHLDPNRIWNLFVLTLFAALLGSRLLLVIANWAVLRSHPLWMLSLAMVHHPLVASIGLLIALSVAVVYAGMHRLSFRSTADVLSAPAALALGFEQIGALLSGAGYGTGAQVPWAIIYSDPLAARWSDAPLGIPVHPVQAYAAICFFAIGIGLQLYLPRLRQSGDLAGLWLIMTGSVMYFTEFWRDPIGRGALFHGVLKAPQAAGIVLVLAGAGLLLERKSQQVVVTQGAQMPAANMPKEQSHG